LRPGCCQAPDQHGAGLCVGPELGCPSGPRPHPDAPAPAVCTPCLLPWLACSSTPKVKCEGGSPSCCAAVPGSTNPTIAAPPTGTATTRPTSTPTLVFAPAVFSPQHPSPSEPLEGIPAGVQEGSRPAPVIGLPIRTTPAHCPMAQDLGSLVGFFSWTPRGAWARGGQPRLAQSAAGLIPSALRWARKQPTLLISGRTSIHLQQPLKNQIPIHRAEFTIGLPLQAISCEQSYAHYVFPLMPSGCLTY